MKQLLFSASLILAFFYSSGQLKFADSLQQELSAAKDDTTLVLIYSSLSRYFSYVQLDSGLYYAQKAVQLSQKINYKYGEAIGFYYIAASLDKQGSYAKALEMAFKCLAITEQLKYSQLYIMSLAYQEIGLLNRLTGDYRRAIVNLKYSIQLGEQSGRANEILYRCFANLAAAYLVLNQLDSALFYAGKSYNPSIANRQSQPFSTAVLGNIYESIHKYQLAEKQYREALEIAKQYNSLFFLARANYNLARLFNKLGRIDTCIYYANESLTLALSRNFHLAALDASSLLTKIFEDQHNTDSTLKYMKTMLVVKDSVFNQTKMQQFQLIVFDEEQRRQQLKVAQERYQNRIRIYALLAVLVVFYCLLLFLTEITSKGRKRIFYCRSKKKK